MSARKWLVTGVIVLAVAAGAPWGYLAWAAPPQRPVREALPLPPWFDEAAEMLGIASGTSKAQLHRARALLSSQLGLRSVSP